MVMGLTVILLLVLFLPFTKIVERNLEAFLFVMGVAACIVSRSFSWHLVQEALLHPLNITIAVLAMGLLFRWFEKPIEKGIRRISHAMPFRLFIALFVIILGLLSSVITAIVAAIILVAVIRFLRLDRKTEVRLVVLACFAIGLGAVLTPIGEPLSTIVVSKLDADFFYLLRLTGTSVIPAVIVFGVLAALIVKPGQYSSAMETAAGKEPGMATTEDGGLKAETASESYKEIVIRSFKIYLFVMALTLLGAGFEPFIEAYLLDLSPRVLYWINMVSAVLDNATLAAAEISPAMNDKAIQDILMGLLISGGMLVPGNIPNIIAAGKIKISSLEYARFAFPLGLAAMVVYFVISLFLV
ncbi:DUF1646 family protein [Heyndrickxia coagulans]|uniref:DUF1646 family protein n=1 Tax=Heyndrickxia coagulans TaxID=1398 RepID=UPI002E23AC7D|nr:DUF1646 family protein [Heyndrickxia coagulans]